MANRQTRIFVPPASWYTTDDWYPTLLGKIILLLVTTEPKPDWYWICPYQNTPQGDTDDWDPNSNAAKENIPRYTWQDGLVRNVKFRYGISDEKVDEFETKGNRLIAEGIGFITDWRPYGLEGDLGGGRFLSKEKEAEKDARVRLMTGFLQSLSELVLHTLVRSEGGAYRFEINEDDQNPQNSTFESVHHMFCMITDVPLRVRLGRAVTTEWMTHPSVNFDIALPIKF